jgi:hypothetical protein
MSFEVNGLTHESNVIIHLTYKEEPLPGFKPRWDLWSTVALWQVYRVLRFPLSVAIHHCSILIHVSSVGWTMGPLVAQFYQETVSPHGNSNIYFTQSSNTTVLKLPKTTYCVKRLVQNIKYTSYLSCRVVFERLVNNFTNNLYTLYSE